MTFVNLVLLALSLSSVDSSRTDREIRLVALRHAADIRSCYEREGLRVDPGLAGTMEVELTVAPNGRVERAFASAATLRGQGGAAVVKCVSGAARNWRYEPGAYAREVIVYPFALVRDESQAALKSRSSD
ncbi:MAG: hypothetical protein JWO05_2167 [Gemmatimonadetes bacterium]|nr:hypothetical protein [Gemmatimonadota bacterium]